jgi:hypothetical protein
MDEPRLERATAEIMPIDSTFLSAVGYNPETRILYLRFTSHSTLYAFYEVGKDVYDALLGSDSKGTFFNQNIRDHFTYTRVRHDSDPGGPG